MIPAKNDHKKPPATRSMDLSRSSSPIMDYHATDGEITDQRVFPNDGQKPKRIYWGPATRFGKLLISHASKVKNGSLG